MKEQGRNFARMSSEAPASSPPAGRAGGPALFGAAAAFFLLLLYAARQTVLSQWLSPEFLNYAWITAFVLCFSLLLLSGPRGIHFPTLLLLAAGGLSSFFCEMQALSLYKWAGWAGVVAVAGPLFKGEGARRFRGQLWGAVKVIIFAISVLSALALILPIPTGWPLDTTKGYSGVTVHSMLMGPIAGLAAVFSLNHAIHRGSWIWGAYSFLFLFLTVLSASRIAIASAACAVLVLVFINRSRLPRFFAVVLICAAVGLGSAASLPSLQRQVSRTAEWSLYTLRNKGFAHTRESLWRNRMEEFVHHPIFGMGIGYATANISFRGDTIFGIPVEPGSGYLAILSMTGLVGALAFLFFIGNILWRFRKEWAYPGKEIQTEAVGMGVFFAVHALAEGWIFAAGTIVCIFFWAWCGRVFDIASGER